MSEKKKRVVTKPPSNETKEARFVRVVTPRIEKAIKYIRLIGNCASSSYTYSPEQLNKITTALVDTVNDTVGKFSAKVSPQERFKF